MKQETHVIRHTKTRRNRERERTKGKKLTEYRNKKFVVKRERERERERKEKTQKERQILFVMQEHHRHSYRLILVALVEWYFQLHVNKSLPSCYLLFLFWPWTLSSFFPSVFSFHCFPQPHICPLIFEAVHAVTPKWPVALHSVQLNSVRVFKSMILLVYVSLCHSLTRSILSLVPPFFLTFFLFSLSFFLSLSLSLFFSMWK